MALLLLAAERVDRIHHQRALHGSERAHAGIAALELLHDQPVGDVVQASAAVLFGKIRAEDAQLGHLRNDLFRESSFDVAVADDGKDFFVDERADAVANGALFFGEHGIDVVEILVAMREK